MHAAIEAAGDTRYTRLRGAAASVLLALRPHWRQQHVSLVRPVAQQLAKESAPDVARLANQLRVAVNSAAAPPAAAPAPAAPGAGAGDF